jgi:glyoxylase-like metal-dependent hydrolase (beta-lactamase superfamily II)
LSLKEYFLRELKKLFKSEEDIEIYKVVLPPVGVNSYVLSKDDSIILVDPGIGISDVIKTIMTDKTKISIMITHSHFDHIMGIDEIPESEILVTKEVSEGLYNPDINLSGLIGGRSVVINNKKTKILDEGNNVYENFQFKVLKFAGHTECDTVFDFGDFLLTGDFVFSDSIGRTDFPYSDENKMKESLVKFRNYLKEKDNTCSILPGHMGYCDIKTLFENNFYLSMY